MKPRRNFAVECKVSIYQLHTRNLEKKFHAAEWTAGLPQPHGLYHKYLNIMATGFDRIVYSTTYYLLIGVEYMHSVYIPNLCDSKYTL